MPVVVANANAPRLGIALPYAPVVNGVPKPKANGGITPGAPKPFTTIKLELAQRMGDHVSLIYNNINDLLYLSIFVFVQWIIFFYCVCVYIGANKLRTI